VGIAELKDLAADVDDATEATGLHGGDDGLKQQERGFDEELQLIEMGLPGLLFDGELGLGAGCVEDKDVDRAEQGFDLPDHVSDGGLITDVCTEGKGMAASCLNLGADAMGRGLIREVIDGDLCSGGCEFQRDGCAEASGGSGDESCAASLFVHRWPHEEVPERSDIVGWAKCLDKALSMEQAVVHERTAVFFLVRVQEEK
jgi:hypothetical protein